jgi:hypothetical protein
MVSLYVLPAFWYCLVHGMISVCLLLAFWYCLVHGIVSLCVLLAFWYCLVHGMVSFLFVCLEHLGMQYGELIVGFIHTASNTLL